MTNTQRWDTFIAWAQRFYAWPEFDASERDYKRVVADQLRAAMEALRDDAAGLAWVGLLRGAIGSQTNNLIDWRVKDTFTQWLQQNPQQARHALIHLWLGVEPEEARVRQFMQEVPNAAVKGQHGMFASFLLLALGPETHPMYRDRAYHMAYRMTGYSEGPTQDSGAIYQHALTFVDTLLTEARIRGLVLRDRLDAQSLLWCVTWSKPTESPLQDWPEQDRDALLTYRETYSRVTSGVRPVSHTPADNEIDDEMSGAHADGALAWMFQYDPDRYDLVAYIREHGVYDAWRAAQHRRRMQVGQRVYILRSGGSQHAALVALGRIVSPPRPAPAGDDAAYRVDVLYEALVEPPLTRQEDVRADAILASYAPFCEGRQGTNFPLPPDVARRTAELLGDRLRPVPSTEADLGLELGGMDPDMDPESAGPPPWVDARTRAMAAVVRRQGQPEFRQLLLDAYEGRCAITGCDAVAALEAAHISPYRGPHTNTVTNGLLLRADLHALFDLGLVAIDTADMTLVLAPELAATTYAELAGQPLRLPADAQCHPRSEALDEHRRNAGR